MIREHEVDVVFKAILKVEGESRGDATCTALRWAQRFCDVGSFDDASEDGTCDPKITCIRSEVVR